MYEKTHKARKNYACANCKKPINKGDVYLFGKGRDARYEEKVYSPKQIGVSYFQYRICMACFMEE